MGVEVLFLSVIPMGIYHIGNWNWEIKKLLIHLKYSITVSINNIFNEK